MACVSLYIILLPLAIDSISMEIKRLIFKHIQKMVCNPKKKHEMKVVFIRTSIHLHLLSQIFCDDAEKPPTIKPPIKFLFPLHFFKVKQKCDNHLMNFLRLKVGSHQTLSRIIEWYSAAV